MLFMPGSISPPAIVGDDENELSAIFDVVGHKFPEYRFITNHRSDANGLIVPENSAFFLDRQAAHHFATHVDGSTS